MYQTISVSHSSCYISINLQPLCIWIFIGNQIRTQQSAIQSLQSQIQSQPISRKMASKIIADTEEFQKERQCLIIMNRNLRAQADEKKAILKELDAKVRNKLSLSGSLIMRTVAPIDWPHCFVIVQRNCYKIYCCGIIQHKPISSGYNWTLRSIKSLESTSNRSLALSKFFHEFIYRSAYCSRRIFIPICLCALFAVCG